MLRDDTLKNKLNKTKQRFMKAYYIFFCMIAGIFLVTCTDERSPEKAPKKSTIYNPNGDSELALLMRDMWDDCMRVKEEVAAGKNAQFGFDPQAIFTAHATEPAKAASETYRQMGEVYLAASESFEKSGSADKKDYFQAMVTTCVACHKQLCPGPVAKINKLYFDVD